MSIKKSLLALIVAAMATMAFASPALATDGVLRDTNGGTAPIPENTALHLIGWTKFATPNASFECHVTSTIKAVGTTGNTGSVTVFTIPDTTKCKGGGLLAGCTVMSHESKNLPYHATVTSNGRLDITGTIEIHSTYVSGCLAKTTLLTLSEVTLIPLKTGERVVTGTEGRLGVTANLNEPIAGFELTGFTAKGEVHIVDAFNHAFTEKLTAVSGEFEIAGTERCTYEITAS